ncbi:SH3 domain-containing protein, partial [Clostridium sp.]|uniref:SH3 domain-containing protein n=1 Tax=Clostridium sp. TaxID=1506 RepID=UPI0039929C6D
VSTKLNIRSGAGTNYGIVGSLGANATVNIIGKEGNWYKISHNGIVGYVSADYIRVNSGENNNNAGSSEKYGKVVNISTKLNIRRSPSTSSSIVGTLSNNTKVIILEKTNGWYKISYNGTVGYVSGSYLMEL